MTDNFPQQTNQGNTVNVVGNAPIYLGAFSKNQTIQFVDLPNLNTPVYGREVEANMLANFFATHKRHCAVVAPSCFGKTFLIRKFLQNVYANDEFYQDSFNQIIYFNCREIADVDSIIGKFETCLGGKLEPSSFFSLIADKKILCIFDNFESWKDNREVIGFLHNIFNANDELRTIFVSQISIGDENISNQTTELHEIGDLLFRGLDQQAALDFARTEGKKVNLDKVREGKLIEFFELVHYIPQAIRSLIGYLSKKRRTFENFLANYQAEFAEYENSPTRFFDVNDELRPTLYLIQLQIEAQDEGSKTLLSVLSFFESDVPESVIAAYRPQVSAVEKETIHSLTDNWLVVETKVFRTDGERTEFRYYSPHSVIKQVSRKVLPKFEDENADTFESLANELFNEAYGNQSNKHNYEESINLYKCVEKLFEHLIYKQGRIELANYLAGTLMNKGVSLASLGKLNEAIIEYERAIEIRQTLVADGRTELANDLAKALMNKGVSLASLGKLNEAIIEYDKAIEILQPLVANGRTELANDLAMALMNKGNALEQLNQSANAAAMFSQAISVWENERQQGYAHNLPNLVKALWIRVRSLIKLEDWAEVANDAVKSLSLTMNAIQSENVSEHNKQQIRGEFGGMLYQITQLSKENQEKMFAVANEIGQSNEQAIPFGDILRGNVAQIE